MTRPHVIVLHRWRGDYALYDRYLSHGDVAVTYVTTEVGTAAVPATAAQVVVVDALDDIRSVQNAAEQLASRHGTPAGIIALKEDDLMTAAVLRERWGCPGPAIGQATLFRDKLLMCRAVEAAGHRLPPFAPADDHAAVRAFADTHGWPVIVKPRRAHSSKGVVKVDDEAALARTDLTGARPLLVQQYNPHPIYYVDGVLRDGALGPWRASRYLNSCLDFRTGDFVGAVEEDDPHVLAAIAADVPGFLSALTGDALVFHLELFVEPGPNGPSCSFLEVGARAGGAEIPYLWRDVHRYDLMEAVTRVQLGHDPRPADLTDTDVAGLLLVPAPAQRPCRVTEATSMTGTRPGPYEEVVPGPGDVIPAGDSVFEQVAGRFRYRGRSSKEVEDAILATLAGFRVRAEPMP